MKKLLMTTTVIAIALGESFAYPTIASAENFNQIYVFGDSLSDVGHVFSASKGNNPTSPPYFKGRYSNGPVWVEYLASKLKLTSNLDNNFAWAGATTSNSQDIPIGLLTQIDNFKSTYASANPNALYVIWAGANDYLGGGTDSTTPVKNLAIAVKSLSTIGAKNIILVNLPDLGKLPGTRNTERSALLTDLTKQHNSKLATSLNGLRPQLSSDINIKYVDVNSLFNQVSNQPEKFGFKNVTKSCLNQGNICNNPNEYLFWDGIHPTTAAHKLLVELAFSELQPKPQSSTNTVPKFNMPLSMIILGGLGSLGAGLLMKRKYVQKN